MDNIDFQITNILERAAPKPTNDNQIIRRCGSFSEQDRSQRCISVVGNNNVIISSSTFWLLCITIVCYTILFCSQH